MLNFVGWFISAIIIFVLFRMVVAETRNSRRRSILYSKGSIQGAGFYLIFGASTVLSDLNANLAEVALVSTILYAISAVLLLWSLRKEKAVSLPKV
jgi:heme A synthase